MKAYIFHGENTVESRKKLVLWMEKAREKGWETIKLDGKVLSKKKLLDATRSQNLFSPKQLIVIENLLSGNKNGVDTAKEIGEKIQTDTAIIFWEGKNVDGRKIKGLQKLYTIQAFKLPQSLFLFLDSLQPGNTQNILKLLQETKNHVEPELLFYMLGRQVRFLLWAKLEPKTLTLPSWQKDKLVKQATPFTADKLQALHTKLLQIDRLQKKSQLPEDLPASLDLLVASI